MLVPAVESKDKHMSYPLLRTQHCYPIRIKKKLQFIIPVRKLGAIKTTYHERWPIGLDGERESKECVCFCPLDEYVAHMHRHTYKQCVAQGQCFKRSTSGLNSEVFLLLE